ncbi:hypothetical protein DOTSEDRAFT_42910 [Dothistroma septosporum NZE10]|uniref:Uncharacterized protein n=1 Tax=Dothistroma septosporum (strain NZE10 / CBS 128990) TaxID=675120 RepID=N1PTV8_DOTSN|nr:hypothetical protein DOTSEDRAFT_42910 [Dothistroma septosporum NZE10]
MEVQARMLAATPSLQEERQSPNENTIRKFFETSDKHNLVVAEYLKSLQERIINLLLEPLPKDLDRCRTIVQQADTVEQLFLVDVNLYAAVNPPLQLIILVSALVQQVVPDAFEDSRVDVECPESFDWICRVKVFARTLKAFPRC